MSLDSLLIHTEVLNWRIIKEEVLGPAKAPPSVVYDYEHDKLRVLAPHQGVYTRKAWGWAFARWDVGERQDVWGQRVLYADTQGVWLCELSNDDQEVVNCQLVAENWTEYGYDIAWGEKYTWPLMLVGDTFYYTTHKWSVVYHDGDYFYYDDFFFARDTIGWPEDFVVSTNRRGLAVVAFNYNPEYATLVYMVPNGNLVRDTSVYLFKKVSLSYPLLLGLDTAESQVVLVDVERGEILGSWTIFPPHTGRAVSLWGVSSLNYLVLLQLSDNLLVLWGKWYKQERKRGSKGETPWVKVVVLDGKGKIKLKFLSGYSEEPVEIYSADGRLVKSLRVSGDTEIEVLPGLYFVQVGPWLVKAVAY